MSEAQQQRDEGNQGEQDLQDIESALFAEFKQKCTEEIQQQTKSAAAKLLYSKREIMRDIKAAGAAISKENSIKPQQSEDALGQINDLTQRFRIL